MLLPTTIYSIKASTEYNMVVPRSNTEPESVSKHNYCARLANRSTDRTFNLKKWYLIDRKQQFEWEHYVCEEESCKDLKKSNSKTTMNPSSCEKLLTNSKASCITIKCQYSPQKKKRITATSSASPLQNIGPLVSGVCWPTQAKYQKAYYRIHNNNHKVRYKTNQINRNIMKFPSDKLYDNDSFYKKTILTRTLVQWM